MVLENPDDEPADVNYSIGAGAVPLFHSKFAITKLQTLPSTYTCGDIDYLVFWDTRDDPCPDVDDSRCVCDTPGDISTCTIPATDKPVTYLSEYAPGEEVPMFKPDNYFPGIDPVNNPGSSTTLNVQTNDRDVIFYKKVVQYTIRGQLKDYPENFSEWTGLLTYIDPCQNGVIITAPVPSLQ